MLHVGVLPRPRPLGATCCTNLRYVVVDEAHVYRGVFGSHVANVLRRLRRLARVYGAEPQFLLASATIANPGELARGAARRRPVTVIGDDAAPRAERTIALWNPPLLDAELGLRASALGEASRLMASLVAARPAHDLLRQEPQGGRADPPLHRRPRRRGDGEAARAVPRRLHAAAAARDRAAARRGRAARRRRRRTRSSSGSTSACSTARSPSAFPGTVASLRQQWGRAGRRGHGLARARRHRGRARPVLHARAGDAARPARRGGDPRPREPARARRPRAAAAFEAPIDDDDRDDARRRGARARAARSRAPAHASAASSGRGRTTPPRASPLRSASADAFTVVDATTGSVLGIVERERAYSTVHEGAVYLHLGEPYLVRELDLDGAARRRRAVHRRLVHAGEEGDDDRRSSEPLRAERRLGLELTFGRVSVTEQVVALPAQGRSATRRRSTLVAARPAADDVRDRGGLVLPEPRASSTASSEMPPLLGALHAAEHALIALLPLWAMCDRWDIGGLSTNVHQDTGAADGLRLRRPPRRRRHHRARLRAVRGLGRATPRACSRGCPCERRLPLLRPEPEVRQPERACSTRTAR